MRLPVPDRRTSGPHLRNVLPFRVDGWDFVLVVDGSRVFAIEPRLADGLRDAALAEDDEAAAALLAGSPRLGALGVPFVDATSLRSPPLTGLSLAISQKCNLACTYCYADGGTFGGPTARMTTDLALQAVDTLVGRAEPSSQVMLAFMGGEPLVNRRVLQQAVERAEALAAKRSVSVSYAITTNGTLVTEDDGEFFETHGFAVTVSLDGVGEVHDRQRPFAGGRGSFGAIMRRIAPLLARQRRMQVSARVTVTPDNLDLAATLEGLVARGFHSVGFSPVLRSVSGGGGLTSEGFGTFLAEMIRCAEHFEAATLADRRYPFSNAVLALQQIHRGTHRPYPCGAGAGYMGLSASGELYACHRFVGEAEARMGSLDGGVDAARQNRFLADGHVLHKTPCQTCWARFLCGGGCHHEEPNRTEASCDYVRGWLLTCLRLYARLIQRRPDWFGVSGPALPGARGSRRAPTLAQPR